MSTIEVEKFVGIRLTVRGCADFKEAMAAAAQELTTRSAGAPVYSYINDPWCGEDGLWNCKGAMEVPDIGDPSFAQEALRKGSLA